MAFIRYNANPSNRDTIDCVIRGMSLVLNKSWNDIHDLLTDKAGEVHEVYLKNDFWIDVMFELGYRIYYIPNTCPDCITVRRFAEHHPYGRYLLGTGSHVLPIYYFKKERSYD